MTEERAPLTEAEKREMRIYYREAKDKRGQIRIFMDLYQRSKAEVLEALGLDSIQQAPKSQLSKRPKSVYTPQQLEQALGAVLAGEVTASRAAVQYGVPANTLYTRLRMMRNGKTRIQPRRPRREGYTEEQLEEAVEYALREGVTAAEAARKYGIPYGTLKGKVEEERELR